MQHNLKCEAVDIKPRLCEALTAKWNHIHNNYNPIVDTACHRDSRLNLYNFYNRLTVRCIIMVIIILCRIPILPSRAHDKDGPCGSFYVYTLSLVLI